MATIHHELSEAQELDRCGKLAGGSHSRPATAGSRLQPFICEKFATEKIRALSMIFKENSDLHLCRPDCRPAHQWKPGEHSKRVA
jgi:hypothetical protein